MDIELIQDQINGFEENLRLLRLDEKAFVTAQGIEIEERKIRLAIIEKQTLLAQNKEDLEGLMTKRADAVSESCSALSGKVGEGLPYGTALFKIESSKVFMSWNKAPYEGLFGSEKQIFDGALMHALGADILIYEAAESNFQRIGELLVTLKDSPEQILACTWAMPVDKHGHENYPVPEEWTVINLRPSESTEKKR